MHPERIIRVARVHMQSGRTPDQCSSVRKGYSRRLLAFSRNLTISAGIHKFCPGTLKMLISYSLNFVYGIILYCNIRVYVHYNKDMKKLPHVRN